jgi:cyclic beta-1,2-glucan synthetase
MDWREFVETMSVVEGTLRGDPGGAYSGMDFACRDRYRHAVEAIAKASRLAEDAVAARAIELARAATRIGEADETAHVGYYLIGPGRPALESATRARLPLAARLRRRASRSPLFLYVGAITLLTLWFAAGLSLQAWSDGAADWVLVLTGMLALLAGGQLATALVNWLATLLASPDPLPRMDYSAGIPAESRALVVVPTLLTSPHNIDSLAEALEVRFLANRDENLRFALLTDLRDAAEETRPEDAPLLEQARERIEALNARYGSGGNHEGNDIFFLLHRPRRWNPRRPHLDGLRAQARQAGRPEHPAARREAGRFLPGGGRHLGPRRREIRDHPGHGHPVAARRRPPVRRRHGAPPQPAGPRCRPGPCPGGYGILQPRVSVSLPGPSQLALCPPERRRSGHRPVYPRRFGRLPGPVPGRFVHRQGHL